MKSTIEIGKSSSGPVEIDIPVLLKTRLLVQANSGGGKSWLIRRLAEQLFGKVPVIIIDPEGEFATLREKFGYVLVGNGGETPADLRSAALVAHKLLELRASAVCDLYELKPQTRHQWVRIFLDALINSPKELWRPVVVIVDEAHQFCPEGKAGESEASSAMVDLATRGRKRGFCTVFATQRLGKLRKDAAAELLNVMVGMTFIDIDRERAAECLGVSRDEKHDFYDEIKMLTEGKFYCLGRAIAKERIMIKVGGVDTTHPEAGGGKFAAAPPPAPDAIKGMLPKLADLPKAAEEKARTEADLRKEITVLKRELTQRPAAVAPDPKIEKVHVVDEDTRTVIERMNYCLTQIISDFATVTAEFKKTVNEVDSVKRQFHKIESLLSKPRTGNRVVSQPSARPVSARLASPPRSVTTNGGISNVCQRILNAIAELNTIGVERPVREMVALMANYTNLASTGYVKAVSQLRTDGLVDYPDSETIVLTDSGREVAQFPDSPRSSTEIQERVCNVIGGKSAEILRPLIDAYPNALPRRDVASSANYTNLASTGFVKAVSRLRTLGFIDYPDSQTMVATDVLFLKE